MTARYQVVITDLIDDDLAPEREVLDDLADVTALHARAEIAARLSPEKIDRLCSLDTHFKHIDATFKALGLE